MTPKEMREEAMALCFGEDCEHDEARAVELLRQAADGQDAVAAIVLGSMEYENTDDYKAGREWLQAGLDYYDKAGKPEEDAEYVAVAHNTLGRHFYFNFEEGPDDQEDFRRGMALIHLMEADKMGNHGSRDIYGLLVYDGVPNFMQASIDGALKLWKAGMDEGDAQCALRYCAHFIDTGHSDDEIVEILEGLVRNEDDPCADACALLYHHYSRMGDDDLAAEWLECGLDMGSELCENIVAEEREEEVEEDSWTSADGGDKCVIIVDTDGGFRIEHADASDWRSLPPLIGAERTDDMRCNRFRQVSKSLGLKGTLLALLDKDAFRKPDLEPNWHASQWYDGSADLCGDMLICLEDSAHNPFSFASEAEARRVADALRG